MFPWLRSLPKRTIFFLKLLLCVSCFHGIIFFVSTFVGTSRVQKMVISKQAVPSSCAIVFMPFVDRVEHKQPEKKPAPKVATLPKKLSKAPVAKIIEEKNQFSPLPKKVAIAPPLTKELPKSTPAKEKQQTQKAVEQEKKLIEQPVAKIDEPKIEKGMPKELITYVGRHDRMDLLVYQEVCQKLNDLWQPPAGITSEAVCTVNFSVSQDGSVDNLVIEKPSGILVFDTTVRAALMQARFGTCAQGKQFVVAFKP